MKRNISFYLLCTLLVTVFVTSCKKYDYNNLPETNMFYGPQVKMGDGKARSFLKISKGMPQELGIELTEGALKGLPEDPHDFAAAFFPLPLHKKAKELTPYDHIGINWNVHGHEPEHVYDVPHFDFHFYEITLEQQLAIPPYEVAPASFDNLPAADYMPSMYIALPGGVPQMGKHWGDLLSPELNGSAFTYTMVYGSYAGKNTFLEPMITLDILKSGEGYHVPFRQPELFAETKYYPTQYNIYMNTGTLKHYVTLSEFVLR